MKTKLFLVATVLTIMSPKAYTQGDFRNGYYITINKDSVGGLIGYTSEKKSNRAFSFKTQNGNKEEFYPEQIAEWGFIDGKSFKSKKLPSLQGGQLVYMEILVEGDINLLRYDNTFYVETDSLIFLPPKEDKLIETATGPKIVTSNKYLGILNYLLNSCSQVTNKIDYAEKELTELIQNYNRCKGSETITLKSEIPLTKLMFQVFSGLDISKLSIDGFEENVFNKSISPLYGISLDISSPRINDRLLLSIEATYLAKYYEGYNEIYKSPTNIYRYDYSVNTSSLKIPLGLRYNFSRESRTPYIKAGYAHFFVFESSMQVLTENEYIGVITTTSEVIDLNSRNSNALWFGAGYSAVLNKKLKGFLELRFEKTNGLLAV